ncbi:MAG: von Willebrand factor type A domain-containing protein [Clostridia bacterium]|nr:von Willebrand factor type A domain-containing protein [Clostridia bacterium]MBQ6722535.1 von Willebrand factor type A domain-containing protein [Clostridia bacterium]
MKKRIMAAILAAVLMLSCTGTLAETGTPEMPAHQAWHEGDENDVIKAAQAKLIELGYLEGEATGVFDAATGEAVRVFQKAHSLLATGILDSITYRTLMDETAHKSNDEWFVTDEYEEGYALAPAVSAKGYSAANSFTAAGYAESFNTNEFTKIKSNGFVSVSTNPLSTFAADVDTSSYAWIRRSILNGEPVTPDMVRIEEMLNYFHYDYRQPENGEPFGVTVEYAPCPWNDKTMLLQIGLQAKSVETDPEEGHNLVFLIDTSGSMYGADRLDLVKRAFLMLLDELNPNDTVSIVAYASQDRVVIEGAKAGGEKTRIMEAVSELEAGGFTNGSAGIQRAYEIAEKYMVKGGVNRILLATDGDLNVGITSEGDLVNLVEEKRKTGVYLTCLGVGMGNYKDNKMEALADYGNGNCWYIDTIHEARKALISEGGGTFVTVAKDVKLQVDFNPARIRGYRLIGYEDRLMAAEDFANDEKDGGEVGSGHRVTVLYEIVPTGSDFDFGEASSKYADQSHDGEAAEELLTINVRAKEPDGDQSELYSYPVEAGAEQAELTDNMKFAAAVAETGMLLRDSEWKGTSTYETALELLRSCGSVPGDVYKEEFVYLVDLLNRE